MFSDLNELKIAGRLGRNPEVKIVSNGRVMATFSIASRHFEEDELYGWREETIWLNVVAWGDEARLVQSQLHKGDHVTLTGRLSIRAIKGQNSGPTKYYTQLVLEDFQKNDRTNAKRNSGAGNGAIIGLHPSRHTIADRYDNATTPEPGEKSS